MLGGTRGPVEEEEGFVWGFSGFLGEISPGFLKDNNVYARRRHPVKKFLFQGVGQTFEIEGLDNKSLKVSGPWGGSSLR